jgi:hypothetical protein
MAEDDKPEPIPRTLREAFGSAIAAYEVWGGNDPEPEVSFDQMPFSITAVCYRAMKYEDLIEDGHWLRLTAQHAAYAPPIDRSFRSGAHYLAELITEKRERFNRSSPA